MTAPTLAQLNQMKKEKYTALHGKPTHSVTTKPRRPLGQTNVYAIMYGGASNDLVRDSKEPSTGSAHKD